MCWKKIKIFFILNLFQDDNFIIYKNIMIIKEKKIEEKTISFLNTNNIKFRKIVLKRSPKSAKDIQELFWCKLSQILKTILFIWEKEPILVVLSWDKKVDISKIKKLTNQKNIRIAKFEEVKELTWYEVSWIWPFWIKNTIKKYLDNIVFNEEIITIWSWNPVIWLEIKSQDLKNIWDWYIDKISF